MADARSKPAGRTVYFDGALRQSHEARLSIDDHGVAFGLGFFETFRARGARPLLWEWHRRRLLGSCAMAGIDVPRDFLVHDEAQLGGILRAMLDERAMNEGVFRYTITAGAGGPTPVRPTETLDLRPLPAPSSREGIVLRVLALRRDNGEWLPRPKSLNFANAILAARELRGRAAAPDDEGLFLSRENGCVVEAVRHNVAWVADGRWVYPDPGLGAVGGTCLQWLLDAVPEFSGEAARTSLDALFRAEAVVVVNSVRGITPVRELWDAGDRTRLATWDSHAHPKVAALRRRWEAVLQGESA